MTVHRATEEDLWNAPEDGYKYELVDGALCASLGGTLHSLVCVHVSSRLHALVHERDLGFVLAGSTGFRLPNGNVRLPDISFVARGRFENDVLSDDFVPFAPDLAVEVLSPADRARHVLDKVGDVLDAGTRLVWVIDPSDRRATVFRSLIDVRPIDENGILDGEDVVPGFRCPLASILHPN